MKYNVNIHYEGNWKGIHYEGGWLFDDIEADSEEEAEEIAESRFADLSPKALINNLADSFIEDDDIPEDKKEKLYQEFENVSPKELINNLADSFVDGVWKSKEAKNDN